MWTKRNLLSMIIPRYLYSDTEVTWLPWEVWRTIEFSKEVLEFENSIHFVFSTFKANFKAQNLFWIISKTDCNAVTDCCLEGAEQYTIVSSAYKWNLALSILKSRQFIYIHWIIMVPAQILVELPWQPPKDLTEHLPPGHIGFYPLSKQWTIK